MAKNRDSRMKKIIMFLIIVVVLILLGLIFRDSIEKFLFTELIGPGGLPDNNNNINPN